jgi:Holliday junction resolvase RusA-like endonuclease
MSRLTIYVTSILRGSRKRGREVNYKFTIPGRLPGINEYTQACRSNPFVGSKMKKDAEKAVMCATNIGLMIDRPVFIYYRFYEKNKRRDLDNISGFAHKVIQDALVKNGILENDGWANITGFDDSFFIDKEHPRIELTIHEVRDVRDS